MKALRWTCLVEGISCIALFFIAMPIKYGLDDPSWVYVIGRVHGLLWVVMVFFFFQCVLNKELPTMKAALLLIVASLPLGMFWVDTALKTIDEDKTHTEQPN